MWVDISFLKMNIMVKLDYQIEIIIGHIWSLLSDEEHKRD